MNQSFTRAGLLLAGLLLSHTSHAGYLKDPEWQFVYKDADGVKFSYDVSTGFTRGPLRFMDVQLAYPKPVSAASMGRTGTVQDIAYKVYRVIIDCNTNSLGVAHYQAFNVKEVQVDFLDLGIDVALKQSSLIAADSKLGPLMKPMCDLKVKEDRIE